MLTVLLTDLLKSFDCFPFELLAAKLNVNGFDISAAVLIFDYLINRKQQTDIGFHYRSWIELLFGVTQGSMSVSLLLSIYHCVLFISKSNINMTTYADVTWPCVYGESMSPSLASLERASNLLFQWCSDYQMKVFADKSHVLLWANKNMVVNIRKAEI